jgi:hypothetical protein
MAKDFERMEDSNHSANPSIHEVSDPARRVFLLGGIGALTVGVLSPWPSGRAFAAGRGPLIGFKSVPVTEKDTVIVPEGATVRSSLIVASGDITIDGKVLNLASYARTARVIDASGDVWMVVEHGRPVKA